MYDMVNDFWDSLPVNWDWEAKEMRPIKDGAGRTDAQLNAMEAQLGVKLPALFRAQYQVQNGGYLQRTYYVDDSGETFKGRYKDWYVNDGNGRCGLFVNDAHMMPIFEPVYTFYNCLTDVYDTDEIAGYFPNWDFSKLVIISFMWGHSYLLLDYGYLGDPLDPPHVVLMETDEYTEQLRVPSYELFISRLDYYREEIDDNY